MIGRGSPVVSPVSPSSSTVRAWACFIVLPASSVKSRRPSSVVIQSGVVATTRPSQPTMGRAGRSSSRHHVTSVVSPKVHTMAMPVPFSGSARGWAWTGTSTPNRGVRTVVPISGR